MFSKIQNFLFSKENPPSEIIKSDLYGKLFHLSSKSSYHNHAIGSIVGAFLGDASGAPLEFLSQNPNEYQIKGALNLEGGGVLQVAPGQITDDSEMAMCLGYALNRNYLDLNEIIKQYRKWIASPPFDIGQTTQIALNNDNFLNCSDEEFYQRAKNISSNSNASSLSNGALMRITPLAVWCHRFQSKKDVLKAVELESQITHSNQIVHFANTIYALAIKELINNKGNRTETARKLENFLQKHAKINKNWQEILDWWNLAKNSLELIPAKPKIGFIKIAWTYAISFLFSRETPNFSKALAKVLAQGGDTDTNACICGGLLGAAIGFQALNGDLVKKLLHCKYKKKKRPDFLHPFNLCEIIDGIMKNSIETLIYSDGFGKGFKTNCDYNKILLKFSYWSEKKFIDKALGLILGFFIGELCVYEENKYFLAVQVINKIIQINEVSEISEYINECLQKNISLLSIVALMGIIHIKFQKEVEKIINYCYEKYNMGINENYRNCWIYGIIFENLLYKYDMSELQKFLQNVLDKTQVDENQQLTLLILQQDLKKEDIWTHFKLFSRKNCEIFLINGAILGSFLGYKELKKSKLSLIDFTLKTETNFRNHPLNLLSLIEKLFYQYKPNKKY